MKIRKFIWKMELIELSSQLKTFDIVDSQTIHPSDLDKTDVGSRRLTRSRSLPRSDVWKPIDEFSKPKNPGKVLDPEDEIRKIYLNNKVKFVHKNLETIYEDPIVRKGNTMFLGTGKQKRSLYLCREFRTTSKQKTKMRRTKIKRLGKRGKSFKMTDDEFKEKMIRIDNFINDNGIEKNGTEKNGMKNHTNDSFFRDSSNEMETP